MNSVLWIFFCFVYSIVSVQTRFIIYSNSTASWFSARKECQNLYNGSMVDVDLIKLVARMNATNRCLRRKQELWLGRVKYTTGHIVYGGCYDTPDTFDSTSVFSNEMSIVKCQMICIHLYAFAIKENVCNCIYTRGDLDGSYKRSSYSKCSFRCLRKYCEFYGGNDTVSIYINSGEQLNSNQCKLLRCNKSLQVKTKRILCSGRRNVSVYCENGNETRNVDSWKKAAEFCSRQNSYLIRNLSNVQCKEGLKIWSDSRTYRDIISIHDEIQIDEKSNVECGFTDARGSETYFTYPYKCHATKMYACTSDAPDNNSCHINVQLLKEQATKSRDTSTYQNLVPYIYTSENNIFTTKESKLIASLPPDVRWETKDSSSVKTKTIYYETETTNTTAFILVVIAVFGLTLAVSILGVISWKRGGCHFRNNNQPARSNSHKPAAFEMVSDGTSYDKKPNENKLRNKHSQKNFTYELVKPISQVQSNIITPLINVTKTSSNEYYVTKTEGDYDNLHQQRPKVNDDVIENDYSHCIAASDDYGYNISRKEMIQLPESDYSHIHPAIDVDIHVNSTN